jgi:hypothetical protein
MIAALALEDRAAGILIAGDTAALRAYGLTPEEHEALERGGIYALRGAKRRIQRAAWWAVFWFGTVIVSSLILAFLAITAVYLYRSLKAGSAGAILASIMEFIFGIAATLAVEFFIWLAAQRRNNSR